ncbi:hypothetical protein GGQ88_001428 [Novosphingobium hassiacum]|uniref:EF-hand domain-containing protein n=1 Tax=Novosphingobium hassiacum TaxID=173676 RepID=A0A7W5ZXU7_9SPHN|nr:hypothetical protein [Novosphingobium hassiacum]MBB3860167.1 hypothetical protein [Novosphingobium hassiacum]
MKKFQLAATAAVMATATVALYAATPAIAQKMDANGDKTITWAEAKAKSDQMWTRMDVNKDGKLDSADRAAKTAERFDKLDTDKNGSLSKQEFAAKPGPDGMAGPEKGKRGDRMGGHGKGGHRGMMGGGMHMMAMADANKDGTVTRAEFDTATKAHFDMADANKDGSVTAEERRAAMKSMMGKMGGMRGHGGMGAMGDGPPPPPPAD